ncbi:sterol desaturase [Seminavis robusta]|uniref:Sterol desaturase n=1 Tax=Seminavis robusta TaxID=568900 RepID=A0A9N8DNY4_9STRA|nr:sterol desaturase [Seminavis robusta]|eukprot:Sro160_g072210.1 sterol desaturase (509) ;mRNA; f:59700-61542
MSSSLKQRHQAKKDEKEPSGDETQKIVSNEKKEQPPFRLMDLLGGVGGMIEFRLFQKVPGWVDASLPPGTTSELEMNLSNPQLWSILSGHSIVFSPNLVWFSVAMGLYVLAPYDYDQMRAEGMTMQWFVQRALLNTVVMLAYYGFWHTTLYGLGWAKRPFAQGRVYRWSKTIHNVWYCLLGVLQWTGWELIMVYLYANNRIGFQSNEDIFQNPMEMLKFFLAVITVPVFREIQFFFAHRTIHLRCLYKYIHALHHRNTDVEPFSGLCMSPAEHLYYISSIAPSVYWHASPFQFLWNGIHLVLSPGASHSGWEDHWHSDQFHVAHHRYFECNYGTPGFPLDIWFGTMRETMAPTTRVYKGVAEECVSRPDENPVIMARPDAKSTLLGIPAWDQMLYMAATAIGLPLFVIYNVNNPQVLPASLAAAVVSLGPLVLASLLSIITANPPIDSWEKLRVAMLYPFQKEPILGKFGLSLVLGTVLSIIPTYHFFESLFVEDPSDTIYNKIWASG